MFFSHVWCFLVVFVGPGWLKKVGETREIKFHPSFVQIRPHGTELWPKNKKVNDYLHNDYLHMSVGESGTAKVSK